MQGVCIESERAPFGDCLFGDDLVFQESIGMSLPSPQMTCDAVLKYVDSLNQSPTAYCSNSNFRQICCQTCKSISHFNKNLDSSLYRFLKLLTLLYLSKRIRPTRMHGQVFRLSSIPKSMQDKLDKRGLAQYLMSANLWSMFRYFVFV